MTHVYGPHIFHTGDERVWAYVQRFGVMQPYRHRVQAVAGQMVYSLPVNLLTINQFFRRVMGPEEARAFVASKTRPISNPANFEEQALSMIGAESRSLLPRLYPEAVGPRSDAVAGVNPQAPAPSVRLRRQLLRPPPPSDPRARLHGIGRVNPRRARSRVTPGGAVRRPHRLSIPQALACGNQQGLCLGKSSLSQKSASKFLARGEFTPVVGL